MSHLFVRLKGLPDPYPECIDLRFREKSIMKERAKDSFSQMVDIGNVFYAYKYFIAKHSFYSLKKIWFLFAEFWAAIGITKLIEFHVICIREIFWLPDIKYSWNPFSQTLCHLKIAKCQENFIRKNCWIELILSGTKGLGEAKDPNFLQIISDFKYDRFVIFEYFSKFSTR